nr:hypothetical protein [Tanacetum cinerariifolium]
MVVNDNPPPPPVNMEKPFGVTNIKSYVPLVLDLDQLNYNAWCELFTSHCHSFGVHGILDGTFVCIIDNATEWKKLDSLVKNVWKSLKDLFHDNKEAHAMEVHEELRSLELCTLSIVEYFKRIKYVHHRVSHSGKPTHWNTQNHPPMQQVFRGSHVPLRTTGPRPHWACNYTYTLGGNYTSSPGPYPTLGPTRNILGLAPQPLIHSAYSPIGPRPGATHDY